MTYDLLV